MFFGQIDLDGWMNGERELASCVSVTAWPSCHTASERVLASAVYINDDNDDKASEGSGAHSS